MDTRPGLMPKARKDRLIIKELPEETLVYDLDTDKAHCLNRTATIVWKNCDGQKSVDQLADALESEVGTSSDPTVVWLALGQLRTANLLEQETSGTFIHVNRREVMRRVGGAALALPAIAAMIAPVAAQAVSCIAGNNTPCTIGGTPCCAPRTCQAQPTGGPQCRP